MFRAKSRGVIAIDEGAKSALTNRGASLLPNGVTGLDGKFTMGARVDIRDNADQLVAVGLVSYSSDEIERMKGKKRSEYESTIGYKYVDEIVHRDDLVLWSEMENS
jgi:glutamate 5-kinase